jgi:hypothetical protein
MTFIYIVNKIASKWVNTLSNTRMIETLVAHETVSFRMPTTNCSNRHSADQPCNEL